MNLFEQHRQSRRLTASFLAAVVLALVVASPALAEWATEIRMTNDDAESRVCGNGGRAVANGPNGEIFLVWQDARSGRRQVFFKFFTPSFGWSNDSAITTTVSDETAPSAVCGSDGDLHVVWLSKVSSYDQVLYSRFCFTKGWSTPEQVTSHSSQHCDPVVAVDTAGDVHVAWYGHDEGHQTATQVFYRKCAAGVWLTTDTLTTSSYAQRSPSIAVDRQGNVHVTWSGKSALWPAADQIHYRKRTSAGWQPLETVTNSSDSCGRPSLAVDPAGFPHVVWHQRDATTRQQIYYAGRNSSNWSTPAAMTTSSYDKVNPSLVGDTLARLHAVWCGCDASSPSVAQVYYRQRTSAGSWLTQEQLTVAASGGREQVLVTAKPDGAPHLVWTDSREGNGEIYYRGHHFADALTLKILAPVGRIDSSICVIPKAVVRNGGTQTAVFPVRLRVGGNYDQTVSRTVASNTTDTVSFLYWTAVTRGTYPVVCSVGKAGDVNPGNNVTRDSVTVSVQDVAMRRIVAPLGTVDSGVIRTPAAWIRNLGTVSESVTVTMRIGTTYNNSQGRVIAAGESLQVSFASWTSRQRGWNAVRCTVRFGDDQVAGNNLARDSVFIRVTDAEVVALQRPAGDIQYGLAQPCSAVVANRGNADQVCLIRLLVGRFGNNPFYRDSVIASFAPGEQRNVGFRNWLPESIGSVYAKCTVALGGDQKPVNNIRANSLNVLAHDVGVLAILVPSGIVDSGNTAVPRVVVRNGGFYSEVPRLVFRIGSTYADTATNCTLAVGQTDTVSFRTWIARERGSLAVRCTAVMVQDDIPGNNLGQGSVFARVLDAEVFRLVAPVGIVDSPITVYPAVQVKNCGTQSDSITLTFRIGSAYAQSATALIAAGQTSTVTFPPTNPGPRGKWAVSCTASLAGDRIPVNNRLRDSILVRVRDGLVTQFISPQSEYDSGQSVVPGAWVRNQGSNQDTLSVRMTIGSRYNDTRQVVLQPGEDILLNFTPWTALQRGAQTATCSVAVLHDYQRTNNRLSRVVTVHVHDLELVSIINVPVEIAESTSIGPGAIVRNPGNCPEIASAVFEIAPDSSPSCYVDTVSLTLAPGGQDTLEFFYWTASPAARYVGRCALLLADDQQPANDTGSIGFSVVNMQSRDVGVAAILQPATRIYPGGIVPKASVRNYGDDPVSFTTYFRIRKDGQPAYLDSSRIEGMLPGVAGTVSFREWQAVPGLYQMQCSTALVGDQNRANDVFSAGFQVDSLASGSWLPLASYPAGNKNKKTKHGASLAAVPGGRIFSLKGSGTNEFYVYSVDSNVWQKCDSLPFSPDKKKKAGKGAALVFCPDDNRLYAFKGNNTREFWSYGLDSNRWQQEPSLPAGTSGRAAKSGAALCPAGSLGGLYAFKGNKTFEFWRFDPAGDSWSRRAALPDGASRKPAGEGGALAVNGDRIFALKGNNQLEWYAYEPAVDRWSELPAVPIGPNRRRVKDGASLTIGSDGVPRMLKGNNTVEFLAYDVELGSWMQNPNLPFGPAGKRVKGGGSVTSIGDQVFALKGNGTFEFYTFIPGGASAQARAVEHESHSTLSRPGSSLTQELRLGPNPARDWVELSLADQQALRCPVRIRAFDAGGRLSVDRLVSAPGPVRLDLSGLASGVYLLELETDGRRLVRKIVIER